MSSKPVFVNAGGAIGHAGPLAAFYAAALETGEDDDQIAVGKLLAAQPTSADLDVEGTIFRTKLGDLAKKPDETTREGPAFLHFPGMSSDEKQRELEHVLQSYSPKN
jgi:hypothetical protein